MDFIGIDTVVFGAPDLKHARRFFADWGLKKIADSASGLVFETGIGSQIVVRPEGAKTLRPRLEGGSNFREVIFGVPSRKDLAALANDLARDREVATDSDGAIHTVDDASINIGFRVWRRRKEMRRNGTPWNGPGSRQRVDRVSPRYDRARPFKMGHIVFFVPDTRRAEAFYRKRLGFWLSDRYVGGAGVFLRWAKRSEHHNLFFVKSRTGKTDLHHIAFEVCDVHEVFGGGMAFAKRGWTTEVGPGRHPISSAYFWYFKNPLGGAIEYFCDADYVTESWKPNNYRVNRFSEWHLVDGIAQRDDGKMRPSLAAVKTLEKAPPAAAEAPTLRGTAS
jgi:catechol 2,3-dioxygenase-like lactoylglutathione lyase family enzyme